MSLDNRGERNLHADEKDENPAPGRGCGTVALVPGVERDRRGDGESLAARGASVAIVVAPRPLEALADSIGDPSRVEVIESDVTHEDQARSMWNRRCPGSADRHARQQRPGHAAGPIVDAPTTSGAGWWRSPPRTALLHPRGLCPFLAARERTSTGGRRGQRELGGRTRARQGNEVYSATKSAVVAFGESPPPGGLCPTRPGHGRRARATTTELASQQPARDPRGDTGQLRPGVEMLTSEDIAEGHRLRRHPTSHVALNEILSDPPSRCGE